MIAWRAGRDAASGNISSQGTFSAARWLRSFNEYRPEDERVGFYGLDVYSLWDSLRAALGFAS